MSWLCSVSFSKQDEMSATAPFRLRFGTSAKTQEAPNNLSVDVDPTDVATDFVPKTSSRNSMALLNG